MEAQEFPTLASNIKAPEASGEVFACENTSTPQPPSTVSLGSECVIGNVVTAARTPHSTGGLCLGHSSSLRRAHAVFWTDSLLLSFFGSLLENVDG